MEHLFIGEITVVLATLIFSDIFWWTVDNIIANVNIVSFSYITFFFNLGNWYETAMDVLTHHLTHGRLCYFIQIILNLFSLPVLYCQTISLGNKKIKEDILMTLKHSPDAYFVSKVNVSWVESHFYVYEHSYVLGIIFP